MPLAAALAVLAALVTASDPKPPPKQSWESTVKPEANAQFWPSGALVEVDGKLAGKGWVQVKIPPGKTTFHVRVSAPGFETEERDVEAARIADRDFRLALRPAGYAERVVPTDAPSMALAAAALWKAKRADDAVEYAEVSLRSGNTALANRVLAEIWRSRGDREKATKYYTMYLSILNTPPADAEEIKRYLLEDRPGDLTIPAQGR